MNRTYKVIWSKARRCYVVVSELAKGQHKSSSKSEQISSSVHRGGYLGKAAAAAAVASLLTFGSLTCSPVMAAGSGDTDTLINKMSGNYNHPDRNLVIKWTDPKLSDGAAIRNVDVNAKNITVEAYFKGNQWNDKGVISEDKTHITASGDIKITSHNDSVFTEDNKTPQGIIITQGKIVIDGFKNLIIKSTGVGSLWNLYHDEGFGLVDNSGGITINGGKDSTVDITTSAVIHPGIGNHIGGGVGTGITINAGKIIKISSNAGSIFSDKGANNDKFKVALNAPVIDLTGIVKANYGDVFLNSETGGTVTIKDKKKGSISAMNGAKVTINEKAQGVVQLDGKISAKSGASVMANMTGAGSYLNVDSNKNAVEVSGNKSNVTLNMEGNDSYLKGNILTQRNGQADIKMTGQHSHMIGDAVDKNGILSLTFGNQSAWTGNLDADSGTASVSLQNSNWSGNAKGNGDISLKGRSLWQMTANSAAHSVNVNAGSVVSLAGTAKKLEVQKLGGSGGQFLMDLKYGNDDVYSYRNGSSDFLVAHDGSGSTYQIGMTPDSSVSGMKDGSKLYFASTKADTSAFTMNQAVQIQNYNKIYNKNLVVKKETDASDNNFKGYDDWFLTTDASKGTNGNTINTNGIIPGAAYNAAFALWRDDDTLLKRLGELRYNQDDQGIWARFTNKRLERDGHHGFEGNFKTLQVGLDKEKKTAHHGSWYYGGAVSHLWGNTDYEQGHGSQKATDFTFYGTNLRPQEHYLDLVARLGRIDSDYDSAYGDHGSFQNWGSSIGAEYGRKKTLRNGWSLEPQAQLTYNYLWGDDYTTRNGARVHQDNADSLVGRLGFVLGREFHENAKNPSRVYLKASVLHDFLGDTTSRISDDLTYTDTDDLGDTWYVVGIGTNIQFADNTQFYFDAEKSFCADVDMKYRFNAGIRFEF